MQIITLKENSVERNHNPPSDGSKNSFFMVVIIFIL